MKRAIVLHCDSAARPYRIEDFCEPLKEAGIVQQVSIIGAYQMSHVWLVNVSTGEAKKSLLQARIYG